MKIKSSKIKVKDVGVCIHTLPLSVAHTNACPHTQPSQIYCQAKASSVKYVMFKECMFKEKENIVEEYNLFRSCQSSI